MNSLHICAHYNEGKLWSVAWLPAGQRTMSTFTWVFWLAAAVFCQLEALQVCVCVCLCWCVCARAIISEQIQYIPVLLTLRAHAARLWQSAWQHSFTNTHYPPTAPYPCSCPREGPSRSKADKHTHTHSSIKIWCRLNVEQAAVKKRDGQQAEKWKNTKLHVLKHRR